jgi:hypothetical protein
MMYSCYLRITMIAMALFCMLGVASAQTTLLTGLKLIDRSNSKTYDWTVNGSASASQGFLFPAAAGTAGQVVKIASLSGTNATFEWTTPAAASTGTSARLAADAVDATSWSTGPLIAVGNSKKYRVVGEFAIKRGTSGSDDDFQIRIASPDAGTYVACAIECLDCPANTTGVPQYKEDTGTNVDFTVINPNGNMEGNVYHYRIEGIFKTDADGAGNVRLTFNKNGGSPTTTMMANSYWALIEIN